MVMFFFCQAEDGIRDDLVTGVQTCALPISAKSLEEFVAAYGVRSLVVRSESIAPELASALTRLRFQGVRVYPLPEFYMKRSEERRVGKECRSRWSPYH